VTSFSRFASSTTDAEEHQWREAAFVEDTWRAGRRLTLSGGLRLEVVNPQTVNAAGNGGWLDLSTGEVRVAGIGGIGLDGGVKNSLHWAPRIGLTWQVDERTVMRTGYGRSYDVGVDGTNFGETPTQNPPVLIFQNLNAPTDFDSVFRLDQGPPPPGFPQVPANGRIRLPDGVTARALPATVRLPAVDAYNLMFQRRLGSATSVELGYVGNKGTHTYAAGDPTFDVNQPNLNGFPDVPTDARRPFYAGPVAGIGAPFGWTQQILYFCACADTRYDSLQATFNHQFSHAYSLTAHYTLQRVREDDRDYFIYDRSLGLGRPAWDRNSSLVVNSVLELPFGRNRRFLGNAPSFVDRLVGGWKVSVFGVVQSGMPFEVTYRDADADRDTGPNRPDLIGDPHPGSGDGLRTPYFNVIPIGSPGSAFGRPAAGTFGNLGRNVLSGPGYWRVDASLFKQLSVARHATLELRLDVVNVFNHVNLDLPDAEVGVAGNLNPNAGLITATAYSGTDPQRNLQLAVRLSF